MSKPLRIVVLLLVLAAAAYVIITRSAEDPVSTEEAAVVEDESEPSGMQAEAEPPLPKLLDLGSITCIPCKKMEPILASLKERYAGRFDVEFIDIRKDRDAAIKHGIRLIPTQIFFDAEGRELFRHEGFYGKEDILAKWKEFGVTPEAESGS